MGRHPETGSSWLRRRIAFAGAVLAILAPNGPVAANGLMGLRAAIHAAAPHPAGPVAEFTAVRRVEGADSAKLTFALSAPVEPTAFVLADPDRVIVDLPQVDFDLDPAVGRAAARTHQAKKGSLASTFRFGLIAPGRSRIVIDLAGPARVVDASVRTTAGGSVPAQ